MADDEQVNEEQVDVTIPEMWSLAKPPAAHGDDEDLTEEQKKAAAAAAGGPKVGKLIKYLNDIEDQEELETKIQERDPATNHSLLLWATLTGKFVVVEWLVKKAKRNAFAFGNEKKELTVFDKWVEIRKEVEDREREKLLNPPEEDADADDEEKQPDPTADQLVFEALSEFHEEWAERANCIVKSIGELGVYQGNRDEQGTKCGLGQTLFPDGDMYTGEYRDNQRHGRGTYFWANHGMIYCGQWAGNKRHGVGRMIFADGARYFGAWADDKIHGVGRYTYPDGSTYNGAWVDGQKHGEGAYTFVDGSRYSGAFVDGEFVSGEWILGASGTRYVGRFKNGVPSGKGVFVFKSRDGGSYRQEGEYVAGKWIPGPLSNKGATPAVELVVQRRSISVGFTAECAALSAEDLVRAINFEPFRTWLEGVENNSTFFINGIALTAVLFAPGTRNVAELTVKVNASDAHGKRIRGADAIVLRRPTARLLIVLTDGDRTVAVVEQNSCAAAETTDQVRLPAVEKSSNGAFSGAFHDVATAALRLNISAASTMTLPTLLSHDAARTNAESSVIAYIQKVHPDTITTAQSRLDQQSAKTRGGFMKVRAVRLADVGTMSQEAVTIVAANYVHALTSTGKLPQATIEPQRPPTPIPPAIEDRPDIEPLLAAERNRNKPKDEEGDE
jgi:radial spoke head protein 1